MFAKALLVRCYSDLNLIQMDFCCFFLENALNETGLKSNKAKLVIIIYLFCTSYIFLFLYVYNQIYNKPFVL